MKPTQKVIDQADKVVNLKSIDDLDLTNIALQIASAELNHNGFYACKVGDKKTLYILES